MEFDVLVAALVGVFGLFGHHAHAPSGPRPHETIRVARWVVRVDRDRFTGETQCSVRRGAAEYTPGAVVLRLGPSQDVSAADFRVDWGAAHNVRALPPSPVPPDVPLRVALANPSVGEIRAPEALLAGAREVEVRPRPGGGVRRFRVDGLAAALERARAAGC